MSKLSTIAIAARDLPDTCSQTREGTPHAGGPGGSNRVVTGSGCFLPPSPGLLQQYRAVGRSRGWKIVIFFPLYLLAALLSGCTKTDNALQAPLPSGYEVSRYITYSFTLENSTAHVVHGAKLWAHAPVKLTSTQRCNRIEASHPYELLIDDLGNQVLQFAFETLPPYGSKIITVRADLSLSDAPNRMEGEELEIFRKPERYIESESREIFGLARDIKRRKGGSHPEAIFRWISENIGSAAHVSEDRGALHCLERKKGDCTEQSYLFAALCRASEIPARVMGGYVCDSDCVLTPLEYHNWAEFFQDGSWYVADPQGRAFAERPSRYISMEVIGGPKDPGSGPMEGFHRFHIEGDGLKARMNL